MQYLALSTRQATVKGLSRSTALGTRSSVRRTSAASSCEAAAADDRCSALVCRRPFSPISDRQHMSILPTCVMCRTLTGKTASSAASPPPGAAVGVAADGLRANFGRRAKSSCRTSSDCRQFDSPNRGRATCCCCPGVVSPSEAVFALRGISLSTG